MTTRINPKKHPSARRVRRPAGALDHLTRVTLEKRRRTGNDEEGYTFTSATREDPALSTTRRYQTFGQEQARGAR